MAVTAAMTRADLLDALHAVDNFDDEEDTRRRLVKIAGLILNFLETERRELTIWEKANLRLAIGTLFFTRLNRLASVELGLVLADPAEIAPDAVQPEDAAELANLTLSDYRQALRHLSHILST
jgi:hypothetical protein